MKVLSKSSKFVQEYCATVVQIGEIKPIEGSDFLGMTLVNGFPIVVRKDQVKEGDVMIYCPIETQINSQFLKTFRKDFIVHLLCTSCAL